MKMSKEELRGNIPDNDSSDRNPSVKRSVDLSENSGDDEISTEPKKKISFGLSKPKILTSGNVALKTQPPSLSLKLNSTQKTKVEKIKLKPKSASTALAFNQNDDDDDEEMPPEAKMRMKNIGRDTPTSSGPNSFGKSRMGFCDSKKMYEKKLREIQDQLNDD